MTTLLHAPLHTSESVTGKFKLAADFRMTGGDLGGGATAFGAITVVPGARNVKLDVQIDGSDLNLYSTEWQVNQVRGIHLAVPCDNVLIENSEIIGMPREAIYAHGARGVEIHHTVSERCESFANFDYQTGKIRRANSGVYVWGHCQHKNGRTYGIPGDDKSYVSVIDPRYFIGGNGINGYLSDAEIADFSCVGEYKGAVKLASSQRVRVLRCKGGGLSMLQGSVYFDFEKGPNEIYNGTQLPFPFGPPGHVSSDITFESCLMDPQFSLWRPVDDPLIGSNTLQLSYPMWNTKVLDCDFWWQPDDRPGMAGGLACIQIYRSGNPVEVRGCRFHKVRTPSGPIEIRPDGQPGPRGHGVAILEEGGHTEWASSVNADWLTVNQWIDF